MTSLRKLKRVLLLAVPVLLCSRAAFADNDPELKALHRSWERDLQQLESVYRTELSEARTESVINKDPESYDRKAAVLERDYQRAVAETNARHNRLIQDYLERTRNDPRRTPSPTPPVVRRVPVGPREPAPPATSWFDRRLEEIERERSAELAKLDRKYENEIVEAREDADDAEEFEDELRKIDEDYFDDVEDIERDYEKKIARLVRKARKREGFRNPDLLERELARLARERSRELIKLERKLHDDLDDARRDAAEDGDTGDYESEAKELERDYDKDVRKVYENYEKDKRKLLRKHGQEV